MAMSDISRHDSTATASATPMPKPSPIPEPKSGPSSRLYNLSSPSLHNFRALCEQGRGTTSRAEYPLSSMIVADVPIYDVEPFDAGDSELVARLQDEWYGALEGGPGVVVLRRCFADRALLERVNGVYERIIIQEAEEEAARREHGGKGGDHFAAAGSNSRIWNSFQKHAERDPASFAAYYSNPWLAHACEAWLGPAYQMTAQVNIVRPGGRPQVAHRDYHLGFQTAEACARYPRAMQVASQLLTLQGAVAHSEMPAESGPTRLLPFSQRYGPGYMAYRLPEFTAYFDAHWVSVPLEAGDALFFNPALFHAAGENTTTDIQRSANLLQISSAFGKPMEHIDTAAVMESCFDHLFKMYNIANKSWTLELRSLVQTISQGYPFPTNLDRRPPAPGGMAPESETGLLTRAVEDGDKAKFLEQLNLFRRDSSSSRLSV